jgi:hypothetical protein
VIGSIVRRLALLVALCLLCWSWLPIHAARGDRLDFDLQLAVTFDESVGGPESVRAEVQRVILGSLDHAACFRSVEPVPTDTPGANPLRLTVRILKVEEETSYDLSIAEQTNPNAPQDAAQQQTTRMLADVRLTLSTLPDGVTLRSKRFQTEASHRPGVYEDARSVVRAKVLDDVVDSTVDWVCKGSESKLRKQIAKSRGASPGSLAR